MEHVLKWIDGINEATQQKLLEYLEYYAKADDGFDYKKALNDDLGKTDLGNDLKLDMKADPSDLKDYYMPAKYEPGYADDRIPESTNWENYSNKKSGKKLFASARQFEDIAAFNKFKEITGLTDNEIVKQVTIEVNGTKVRFDFIGKDETGKFYFGEAKFSSYDRDWTTSWYGSATKNQKPAFTAIKNGNVNSLVVKATDQQKINDIFKNLELNPNDPIDFNDVSMQIFDSFANDQQVKQVITLKAH